MSMKLTMRLGPRSYDIILHRGSLGRLGQLADLRGRKIMVVTDDGVPAAYADTVLAQCRDGHKLVLPQGESTKCMAQLEYILAAMLEAGFGRRDAVVAVGGGVVGDLAGLAAALYMRGVAFLNCPTTTLSQIDSSIGGKTAIDLGGIKNVVGAFYQPQLVVADPDTLATLPRRHYVNGLAEAIKAGLIADADLFALFEQGAVEEHIEEILARSLEVKKAVVEQDERETGPRAALNFGHTIGHAIESRGKLLHGECVALGMLPMLEDKKLAKRVKAVCKTLGLPTSCKEDPAALFAALCHDKKAAGGGMIRVVRVPEAGAYHIDQIALDDLKPILEKGIS